MRAVRKRRKRASRRVRRRRRGAEDVGDERIRVGIDRGRGGARVRRGARPSARTRASILPRGIRVCRVIRVINRVRPSAARATAASGAREDRGDRHCRRRPRRDRGGGGGHRAALAALTAPPGTHRGVSRGCARVRVRPRPRARRRGGGMDRPRHQRRTNTNDVTPRSSHGAGIRDIRDDTDVRVQRSQRGGCRGVARALRRWTKRASRAPAGFSRGRRDTTPRPPHRAHGRARGG